MTGKSPQICIIGAGFSGICAGIQIEKQLGHRNYTIFDENKDFGGTWLVNTYPGCACDVQSHLYSFSFELNPNWSESYAPQEEILAYMKRVADKYDLGQNTEFNSKVQSLEWNEKGNYWDVTIFDKISKSTRKQQFDFVISGVGGLRMPLIPQEFEKFTGPKMHSAQWNPKMDLKGKKVGVIGSGASAIQIIPALAPTVSELHSYQRKPAWVVPRNLYKFHPMVQKLFEFVPYLMILLRWFIFLVNELKYYSFKPGTWINKYGQWKAKGNMRKVLNSHKDLLKKLTPPFAFGCKRVLVSSDYFDTFTRTNVHLNTSIIKKIEKNSITTEDGDRQELDVLILATGFRVQDFFHPLKIIGRGKIDIQVDWKYGPKSYYGVMSFNTPNLFSLLGPNTGLGHNSIIFMIEVQTNYIMRVLKETMKKGAKVISVKKLAESKWMSELEKEMKVTVWGSEKFGSCGSWYKNSYGKVTALWPKNCTAYHREMGNVSLDDIEFN